VVAASGNQGTVGSSPITRHPWVVPVAGCDREGRPTSESNVGRSIGTNGLRAPAQDVTSLGTDYREFTSGGTSAAAPFVTGAVALLWSEFQSASASAIKMAVCSSNRNGRKSVTPPLLDAWAAYEALSISQRKSA
jgi:subtilisin family serine protease